MAVRTEEQLQSRGRLTQGIIAGGLTLSVSMLAILLVWLVWSAQIANDTRMAAHDRERHTLGVLITTRGIMQNVLDAQSAERGVLLTQNPAYLDRYAGAWQEAGQLIGKLARDINDNPRQVRNVVSLRQTIVARRAEMDALIALSQRDALDEMSMAVRFGAGKRTMDRLRAEADAVVAEENRLLAVRQSNLQIAESNADLADNLVFGLGGGLIALVALLVFATLRQRRTRLEREIDTRAGERLAVTQRLLQLVIDSSPDPIFVKDLEGRYVYANRRVGEVFGMPLDEIVGHTNAEFMPPAVADEVRANDYEVIRTGNRESREEVAHENGIDRVFFCARSPWREAGEIMGVIGISRDITELKEEEKRLQFTNAELEARVTGRTSELTDAVARLETEMAEREVAETQLRQLQKMESIGQLSGGIAHDFNNMLAIVIGSLDLAKKKLSDNAAAGLLENIDNAQEGASRAAALTARLLAYARQQPLAPTTADLNALVRDVCNVLKRTLGDTIEIDLHLAPALGAVSIDVPQLESAIINIAVNARDAMPAGGRLTIATGQRGRCAVVRVSDTGSGMPPETVAKAFDPFFTTKDVGKGTGMGLSQVQGFIAQSGGEVSIESVEGKGTTVEIALPMSKESEQPVVENETVTDGVTANAATILVVEDEMLVRKVAVAALEDEGHIVHEAGDGFAALEILAARTEIELMMTDIAMPRMDGRELAGKAREMRPDLRILFTTGYDASLTSDETSVLQKPYLTGDLINAIQATLAVPA